MRDRIYIELDRLEVERAVNNGMVYLPLRKELSDALASESGERVADAIRRFDAVRDYESRERTPGPNPMGRVESGEGEDVKWLRQLAYGLETGYFRDPSPAVAKFALDSANFLRSRISASQRSEG